MRFDLEIIIKNENKIEIIIMFVVCLPNFIPCAFQILSTQSKNIGIYRSFSPFIRGNRPNTSTSMLAS